MNDAFAMTTRAMTAILASLAYIAEAALVTVTGRAFSRTVTDWTNFL